MAYEFMMDTHGHYIVPPPHLMPLYGLWNGSRWAANKNGVQADTDARTVAALATNWPDEGWTVCEIGPDGLRVEETP